MIDTKTADHIDAAIRSLQRLAQKLRDNTCKPCTAATRLDQLAQDLAATIAQANHYLPVYCRHCGQVMKLIFRTRDVASVKCPVCIYTRIVSLTPAP